MVCETYSKSCNDLSCKGNLKSNMCVSITLLGNQHLKLTQCCKPAILQFKNKKWVKDF